ncbi:ribonuclease HII [Aminipila terrae]|uniref:Ribonuclease HII n=1 Tax=Aminipila terrae TaxID=2697030 RepID=A0A6P1MA82_9FIRM|nr:ribonuclease HII [Aminipila terrae]QHI71530.1 ribonuclease HII [Aminipila terrae]
MNEEEKNALLKEKLAEMKSYEDGLYKKDICFIAGVDEVGRGPLAGPVVTACVVLPKDFDVLGVDDSKKLSEKKRNELFEKIKEKAIVYAIGMVDNHIIDDINILEATKRAMKEAILKADEKLRKRKEKGIEHILIDALTLKDVDIPQTGIIKGDANSVSIAAASILAKVTRDRMMIEYAEKYTDYAFEKNKGYGTKAHYEGIDKAGICEIHRKTFLKKILP